MAIARKKPTTKKAVKITVVAKTAKAEIKTKEPLKTLTASTGMSRRTMIIALVVAVIIIAGVLLRNQVIVATVNGKPISRLALITELERQSGKKTLDVLITKKLIFQEATNKNIVVSDKDISAETKKLEASLKAQGQDLNALLTAQGMSKAELNEQIRMQILIKKILAKEIIVTDKEVDEYIEKNKEAMPTDMSEKDLKAEVRSQLEQQKLSEASNKFIASLREKAKVEYLLNFK